MALLSTICERKEQTEPNFERLPRLDWKMQHYVTFIMQQYYALLRG